MDAMLPSVWGWSRLFWWRWWSTGRPAGQSWTAGNVGGRKVTQVGGRSLRRPSEHQYKASALLLRGLLIFSMFFRIMSCNVTFAGGKKKKKSMSGKFSSNNLASHSTTDDQTKTYILVSELGNYDLQTDVFLLINLCYRAPIVLLKSPKSHFRRYLPWILKIQTIVNKQQLKEAENEAIFKYLSDKRVSKGEWRVTAG